MRSYDCSHKSQMWRWAADVTHVVVLATVVAEVARLPTQYPYPVPGYNKAAPPPVGQCCAANFIRFCFCLWLQNHTRTTFFLRSNFSAIAAIFSPDGRG